MVADSARVAVTVSLASPVPCSVTTPASVTVATDSLFDAQANVTPAVSGLPSVPMTVTDGVAAPCASQTVVEGAPRSTDAIEILSIQVSVAVPEIVPTVAVIVAWVLVVASAAAEAVVDASTAVPVSEAAVLAGSRVTLS